jgi:hypothetical protein
MYLKLVLFTLFANQEVSNRLRNQLLAIAFLWRCFKIRQSIVGANSWRKTIAEIFESTN